MMVNSGYGGCGIIIIGETTGTDWVHALASETSHDKILQDFLHPVDIGADLAL
jgi:hypothetical protein